MNSNMGEQDMNNEINELRNTMGIFALRHCIDSIPEHYYEKTVNSWKKLKQKGYNWDKYKATAALLYASVTGGYIHKSQMTANGLKAMDWAKQAQQALQMLSRRSASKSEQHLAV